MTVDGGKGGGGLGENHKNEDEKTLSKNISILKHGGMPL